MWWDGDTETPTNLRVGEIGVPDIDDNEWAGIRRLELSDQLKGGDCFGNGLFGRDKRVGRSGRRNIADRLHHPEGCSECMCGAQVREGDGGEEEEDIASARCDGAGWRRCCAREV